MVLEEAGGGEWVMPADPGGCITNSLGTAGEAGL